jgi:hypothetical protein
MFVSVIFAILLFVMIISIFVNSTIMTYSKKHPMHIHHRKLKQLAARFHRLCIDNDIHYFIIGGTLLGAYREMDIIAHDDDVDVAMYADELTKLNHITLMPLNIKSKSHCYKFTHESLPGVFIDVFIVHKDNGYIKYTNPRCQLAWPRFRIPESDVHEPTLYQLGTYLENKTINKLFMFGPVNGANFCKEFYGENWMEPIITHQHLKNLTTFRASTKYDQFQIAIATTVIILISIYFSIRALRYKDTKPKMKNTTKKSMRQENRK